MKTTTILFNLSGDERSLYAFCGTFRAYAEVKQICTYSIENGLATITDLKPVYSTRLPITLPLQVPVNDMGSGVIREISFDVDTMQPSPATCPRQHWADRRSQQPTPTIQQTLMADYISLL